MWWRVRQYIGTRAANASLRGWRSRVKQEPTRSSGAHYVTSDGVTWSVSLSCADWERWPKYRLLWIAGSVIMIQADDKWRRKLSVCCYISNQVLVGTLSSLSILTFLWCSFGWAVCFQHLKRVSFLPWLMRDASAAAFCQELICPPVWEMQRLTATFSLSGARKIMCNNVTETRSREPFSILSPTRWSHK